MQIITVFVLTYNPALPSVYTCAWAFFPNLVEIGTGVQKKFSTETGSRLDLESKNFLVKTGTGF